MEKPFTLRNGENALNHIHTQNWAKPEKKDGKSVAGMQIKQIIRLFFFAFSVDNKRVVTLRFYKLLIIATVSYYID